ncbi:ABC transporter ATP-binding protein/permease, partial [bacterium M00.F.Ca.ET.228.01.1.1]
LNHAEGAKIDDAEISAVLGEVGLERLSSRLDRSARWEHELADDEQRLLAFARLALRKPKWVIIDEALDAFDGPSLRRVLAMMEKRLPETAILNIGRGLHNT